MIEKNGKTPTLEDRIRAALNANASDSGSLSELITEVEAAYGTAATLAEELRTRATDLVLEPDGSAVRERLLAAELERDRLQAALPRLRSVLAAVLQAEQRERWTADANRVEAKRNAAAEKLMAYPELVAEIIEAFREAKAIDQEIDRVNLNAPVNEHRRLRSVELAARALNDFTTTASLLQSTKLFDWQTGQQLWPPPQPNQAALLVENTIFPTHLVGVGSFIGPGWETPEMQERFRQIKERDRQDQTNNYARMTHDQDERIAREEAERQGG